MKVFQILSVKTAADSDLPPRSLKASPAFSLVEVTLALGIASFALLAIFAVLPVGVSAHQSAVRQTTAIIADLRQIPASSSGTSSVTSSPRYDIAINSTSTFYLDAGGGDAQQDSPEACFKVKVNLATDSGTRKATRGTVTISWPAAAKIPIGSTTAFIAMDRN